MYLNKKLGNWWDGKKKKKKKNNTMSSTMDITHPYTD
jgi:hypothetical protein